MTTITFDGAGHASTPIAWTGFVASFSEFCAGVREGHDLEPRYRTSHTDLAEMNRSDIYRAALLGRPV